MAPPGERGRQDNGPTANLLNQRVSGRQLELDDGVDLALQLIEMGNV